MNRSFRGTYRLHLQGRKLRFISQDLHGATTKNTAFFVVNAVKTLNPTILLSVIVRIQMEREVFINWKYRKGVDFKGGNARLAEK
jgi:hypothetical protein